jgi:hypothetical protein
MSFLRRLFRQANPADPLLESAEKLVWAANVNAIGMFTTLRDQFPSLQQVDAEHSDFILTVASVFIAATRLNNLHLGDDREGRLMEIVAAKLDEWKSNGISGFEDCKGLFEKVSGQLTEAAVEPSFVASDAVGTWIVWNMFGRPPQTDEARKLVRVAGGMVVHTFFNWWEK